MKKILIVSQAMELGGVERALLGLLETIDTTKYEVSLFLMRHTGELLKYIPENIELMPKIPEYSLLAVPITEVLKSRKPEILFGRTLGKLKAKAYCKKNRFTGFNAVEDLYSHKYTVPFMPFLNENEYDMVISFLTPHYIVNKKVKAKKKIAWIHTDYASIEIDVKSELEMWNNFDCIVSISNQVSESFLKMFPLLKERIIVIQNIMPIRYMRCLMNEFDASEEMRSDGTVKLLSVGRFCTAKNFDNVPEICKRLRDKGLDIRWYLIGYGVDEPLIRKKIAEYKMDKYIIVLGKKENPYPYFKQCDIYVQPSRYEGKCMSVIEAQMLHKPVVISNYATARNQLIDGYDGIIVPLPVEDFANGIEKVIRNKELQSKLVNNTMNTDYSNYNEIKKIYSIIEN
ncbi:glycosyltransferase [Enterocloster bolteae]|uniref:glycosyltransferase n=1 Tax=Enterocloster bolteae TaxID=208479 RepID=UPI00210EB332|nr:glycosyltransferase [Enterocloster bolteae]